jgi:hypothetical protein
MVKVTCVETHWLWYWEGNKSEYVPEKGLAEETNGGG